MTLYYQEFSKLYYQAIDGLIESVNGDDRPSDREENKIKQEYTERTGGTTGSAGGGMNYARSGKKTQTEKLIDALRKTRAENISIYASPDCFCCYTFWKEREDSDDKDQLMTDSWYSQVAYWIQQDVILSIDNINSKSATVQENPIKRLIEVSFGGVEAGMGVRGRTARGDKPRRVNGNIASRFRSNSQKLLPEYVTSEEGDDENPTVYFGNISEPWTGHVSDNLADVVHFEVGVIIDSTRMVDFINKLQEIKDDGIKRNQITVLETQMEAVDIDAERTAGYYYGPASLTVLRLTCEYTFFKDQNEKAKTGYEYYKPKPVKDANVKEEE